MTEGGGGKCKSSAVRGKVLAMHVLNWGIYTRTRISIGDFYFLHVTREYKFDFCFSNISSSLIVLGLLL